MEPPMTPEGLVEAIMRRLAGRHRIVPGYVVRDAVDTALAKRFPGTPPGAVQVPPELAAELIAGVAGDTVRTGDDASTMPAVLDADETGKLMTGLGLAVHLATFNLDRDRLHVAQVLNGAAAALVALGAASRAAHADGTAAVLVSPATLRTARTTMIEVLQGLRDRGWRAEHLDMSGTTAIVAGVLAMLGAVP
ncbi:hypothetical protein [Actinoplanes sp. NPDC051851]|uniref:hypothetical protein n=1 Tax=Actinoplanes sp. NPDC051851 TaxID=3154753 RepID=UPI003438714B